MSKILHLIGKFEEDSGGAQRVILDIINSTKHPSLQMGICSLFGNASLSKELPDTVFEQHLGFSNKYNPKIYLNLYNLILTWEPDIVHVHSPVSGIFGRPIAKLLGVKLVSTVHTDVRKISTRNRILDKLTIKLSDGIICVSTTVKESVLSVYSSISSKIEFITIPNCIDCGKFKRKVQSSIKEKRLELNINDNAYIVGTVGSLRPPKGHKYLLKGWARVLESYPDSKLLLVGDGKQKENLKKISDSLGINDSILFLGSRSDVPDLLNIMDIFVFPSLYEGLPIALLEAMCLGKIIIASEIPHISNVLQDAGIYVPASDPESLGKAMVNTLRSLESKKALGDKAKQHLERNFSTEEFGNKYDLFYRNL